MFIHNQRGFLLNSALKFSIRKAALYLCFLFLLAPLFNSFSVSAAKSSPKGFQDIKIISAEKLTYKDGFTQLEGAVQMLVDDLLISAPEVKVQDKKKAEFLREVKVSSDRLNIVAKHMEVDLATGLIKIYSGLTEIKQNQSNYNIDADLQTMDYKKGFFTAKSDAKQMTALHKDLTVSADRMEGQFNPEAKDRPGASSQLDKVLFIGSVIAKKETSQIKSDKLLIFPQQKLYRAIGDASFIYLEPTKEFRLKGDFLNLEELEPNKYVVLASTNSSKKLINFTSPARKLAGRAKFARLWLENDNASEVVFTGDCDIRIDNKRIQGEEVYLDNVNKKMLSNLNRPKAIMLKREKLTF
jgi:lipopolysaccharide assembly outer membrane protein LptD (OstA)